MGPESLTPFFLSCCMNETASHTNPAAATLVGLMRLRVALKGLAVDFWHDAPFPWDRWKGKGEKTPRAEKAVSKKESKKADKASPVAKAWTGDRIQVIEKLWGEGHSLPGNDEYIDNLVTPLGLTSDMSVLDLSAGLGTLGRKLAKDFGSYVTGMEPNQVLAARGMIMSIAAGKSKQASVVAYDPATFTAARKHDCIFARELFFKIIGKDTFFKEVAESLKSGGGQIVFTDYILDHKHRENPAVKEWLAMEPDAAPLSSIEMIKHWKGLGFDLRVAEDQTDLYKAEILKGFARALEFLTLNVPDEATKPVVVREIFLWLKRLIAFEQGLRYYRFYGIKH